MIVANFLMHYLYMAVAVSYLCLLAAHTGCFKGMVLEYGKQ